MLDRLCDAFQRAEIRQSNGRPYTKADLKRILNQDNASVQRALARPLRQLSVYNRGRSPMPLAKKFRKVCDVFMLSNAEAEAKINHAFASNTVTPTYIYDQENHVLTYMRQVSGNVSAEQYALNPAQDRHLIALFSSSPNGEAIPQGHEEIQAVLTRLGPACKVEAQTGDRVKIIMPAAKQYTETAHNRRMSLDQWLANESSDGQWGSDDSAEAVVEELGVSLSIHRRGRAEFNSGIDSLDPSAPRINIEHNGSNHWTSQARGSTSGDGNCLFNALAQEIQNVHQLENTLARRETAAPPVSAPARAIQFSTLGSQRETIAEVPEVSHGEKIDRALDEISHRAFKAHKGEYKAALLKLFSEKSVTSDHKKGTDTALPGESDEAFAKRLQIEEIESVIHNKPK